VKVATFDQNPAVKTFGCIKKCSWWF